MRCNPLLAVPLLLVLAILPGCASLDAPADASDSARPEYRFDDPSCSPAEQQAIRAATRAVIGTDAPSAEMAQRLHFSITHRSADSWFIAVWQYAPNDTPGPFTGVLMDDHFVVTRLVGGG